ncbi:hypothetical protein F5B21DRAFT_481565 [Xylaria acuta]|nr:hypothetical protein F5B21DRAFT_481565 [Xylaria acuta]
MHARRQNIEDAHANTCDWLFSTAEFKKWRYRDDLPTNNGVLWIKGKPGAGKSTLMNHTLSYCEEAFGDHLIVAYFFNARGGVLEKTPPGMMRSIVYQLLKKEDTLHNSFLTYYREKRMMNSEGTLQWEQSELKHFIQTIAKQPQLQSKPLLLLVDALDECDEKDVRGVVDFLQTLSVNAVRFSVELRICLSSRHYPSVSMRRHLELIVERRQEHREDIAIYVEEKLYTENERIKDQVREKANGIFMWVVLVVAMLNKAYDEGRDEAMQKTLDEVPEDLEGVFKTLLERGDSDKAELINMLQWVLFSGRPLTPGELYMATVSESLPSYEVVRRRITSSSRGLIEVRRGDVGEEFVQFIHLSVNDFLYRIKRLETLDPTLEPDAISASHARLWAYCWSCIKPLSTTSTNSELLMGPLTSHQFLQYAADYMVYHADKALLNDTAGRRFDREIAQWLAAHDNWLQWLESAGCFKGPGGRCVVGCVGENSNARLIYALAHARYRNLVKFAVTNDASVSSPVGLYGNAVQTAAWFGYYETIEILLEKGADINAQYGFFGNALQTASSCGHYKIAKLLLENGADVNAQGGSYGTALQAAFASWKGRDVVDLLLERGAER